jgi:hypothetical protein
MFSSHNIASKAKSPKEEQSFMATSVVLRMQNLVSDFSRTSHNLKKQRETTSKRDDRERLDLF